MRHGFRLVVWINEVLSLGKALHSDMKTNSVLSASLLLTLLLDSGVLFGQGVESAGPRNPTQPPDRVQSGPGRDPRSGPGGGPRPPQPADRGPDPGPGSGSETFPNHGQGGRDQDSFAGSRPAESPRLDRSNQGHARRNHLRRAAEQLHAAGMHEMADHVERMALGGDMQPWPAPRDEERKMGPRGGIGNGHNAPRMSPQRPGPGTSGGPGSVSRPQRGPEDQPDRNIRRNEERSGGQGMQQIERTDAERLRREVGEMRQKMQQLERDLDRLNQQRR